jgi:ElaB/YqjD/DUF883 family membrane-anchored ribosome-binding protein
MSHAEQLEQETEQTRAQIAATVDELRARMTPGHVLDQLADRMSEGAPAAFARNLKDQTVNNPLPVALIGAGLAWLMLGARGPTLGSMRGSGERLRSAANDTADSAGRTASEWSDSAADLGRDAGDRLSATTERARQAGAAAAGRMRETAGSMADAAREGAAQTADTIRDTAGAMSDSVQRTASSVSDSARAAGQRTLQSGNALLDFCREQPMFLAGLGLAVGAVIGALLPASETEDRLMGETSDRLKDRAQDLATEQYEAAKKVGERAYDAAKEEAAKQANQDNEPDRATDDQQRTAGDTKAEGPTLVPSDKSELERRGQPWTSENAPL